MKKNRSIEKHKVGVIGLGYVGLPRALQFCKKKISVIGFDIDKKKISKLNNGESYLTNVKSNEIKKYINNGSFIPTSDFSYIRYVNNVIICLPTPLKKNYDPDLSYLKNTFKIIKKFLIKKQMICLESTSYPGTTFEVFVKPLKKKFSIGKDFYVSFSPERNDPGLKIDISTIPKIVSGYSKNCIIKADNLYKKIFQKVIKVKTLEIAEMTKIYENVFRAVNIGFVNEMKKICSAMNIDITNVIESAKTKPFGFMPFYPGPGLGGHCIPIDPFYLSWKAKKLGIKTEFIKISGKINRSMPSWIIKKVFEYFKQKQKNLKKDLKNMKFLILGISYKRDINDLRESPALEIINQLLKFKASVEFYDPFFSRIPVTREFNLQKVKKTSLDKSKISKFDATILVTDHSKVDYKKILKYSKVIFDTRNKLRSHNNKKVIKL